MKNYPYLYKYRREEVEIANQEKTLLQLPLSIIQFRL